MKKGLKKLLALGLVAVMAVGMVGCGNKKDSSSNEQAGQLEQIQKSRKFIVGTSPDYPPFEFIVSDNGNSKVVGADIDFAKKLADKMGVELEIKSMDFDALLPALQSGQVNAVIAGMSPDAERRKQVDFSDIYFKGENAVVVRKGSEDKIKSENELKNMKIGVQKGSTQETYVAKNLGVKDYKALLSIPDLINDLKNGNIDAVVLNSKVANLDVQKFSGIAVAKDLKLTKGGEEESMAVAFKKGNNKKLLELVNSEIKSLNESGEYDKILANAFDMVQKQK